MRDLYHEELDSIGTTLIEMTGLVAAALNQATDALLNADLQLAEKVISGDEQVDALRKAKGAEFDRLFLTGMMQHHNGALTMVKDLFNTAGSGQDAELFNFATDVDNGQRAEIRIMENMLSKEQKEK